MLNKATFIKVIICSFLFSPVLARANMQKNNAGQSKINPPTTKNLTLVDKAIIRLQHIIAQKEQFKPEDQTWLTELQQAVGRENMLLPNPDKPSENKAIDTKLLVENFNSNPEERIILLETLLTARAATYYQPKIKKLEAISLPIHNSTIATYMHGRYTYKSFTNLYNFSKAQGVFTEEINSATGLVKTASLAEGENPEMQRQWVTDTIRCGDLERNIHPKDWLKALITLTKFYKQPAELKAFNEIITEPNLYRKGGVMMGVAHIFNPQTLARDANWFNNKRLESHGLALKALTNNLIEGLVNHTVWGFSENILKQKLELEGITETISNLAAYFIAIHYPDAPSAGPWEETPFPGGLTWDTEIIRSALASFKDLMFNKEYENNSSIKEVRKLLLQTKHHAVWEKEETLTKAIAEGQEKVISRLVLATEPLENPMRPKDASMVFVTGSDIQLANELLLDVRYHFRVLDYAEKELVRENGMLRYAPFTVKLRDGTKHSSPDSYLAKNYWLAFDKENKLNLAWHKLLTQFGSKDTSDPEVFIGRAQFATPKTEAEWFMVSDIAYGYAYQTTRVLTKIAQEKREAIPAEILLIEEGMNKTTEFINRSYARITAECSATEPCLKANGKPGKPYAIPEAFEYVSTLNPNISQRAFPGADTPLAWAKASLYRASKQFLVNLNLISK